MEGTGPRRNPLTRLLAWIEHFPMGAAPFWILVAALLSGLGVFITQRRAELSPPDLTFTFFTRNHIDAYMPAIAQFEKEHHCRIQTELINLSALQSRLRAAILSGSKVPDVVELLDGSMGYFASGPLEDVGFVDFTQRIKDEGLDKVLVTSRLSNWSSRGHVFAMPHDVHPVALAYRRDLVEQLGIDPDRDLDTWDKFMAVGRRVTRDLDGDGVIDRYMIDLPEGSFGFIILYLQRGGEIFDAEGRLAFDTELTVDVFDFYVKAMVGKGRIAYPCGWGQNLTRAQMDGLALFYLTPDWRSKVFEMDSALLKGKMALMPLPAWTKGGSRASTWGGTGICITQQCKNKELAWEFVKYLYYTPKYLGARFLESNIIPPLKTAWDLPEFKKPNPYYSNQPLGTVYARMAPQVPPVYSNPFSNLASTQLAGIYTVCARYYGEHGEEGFRDFIRKQVHETAEYVQKNIDRNAFWRGVSRGVAP